MGCAGIAEERTIPGMLKADNANLYALASRTQEKLSRFEEKFNPEKTYLSYEELLDDPMVDAIYLPLPNSLHYEWAIKAAKKKKHVLCEKPLALNEKEVIEMFRVFKDNDVLLMEAFASRHSPVLQTVKNLIDENTIGPLKYIEGHFSFLLEDENNVRLIKELGGGATYDIGAYPISTIRYLAGKEPLKIQTIGEIHPNLGVDISSSIMMEFDEGLKATAYSAFNTPEWTGYTVLGEKGRIEVPLDFNASGSLEFELYRNKGKETIFVETPNNYTLEIEQFGRAILDGEEPLVTYDDSLGNAKVIDIALAQMFAKKK